LQATSQLLSSLASFVRDLVNNSASMVKDVQNRLDSISDELAIVIRPLGLPDGPNPCGKPLQYETSSLLPELVMGRDGEVEKMVKLMLQSGDGVGSSNEATCLSLERAKKRKTGNFSVLPVVGMGGMGKTTLAQLIYNDERVKNHFDLRIWVCVSDYFDLKKITKEMIESANRELAAKVDLRNYENLSNLDSLQQIFKENVASRRYLLVLDDVWHANTRDWESLCKPLRSGLQGSMIIITTRLSRVAETVGTLDPFQLKDLPPDVFLDLFKKCSFRSFDPSTFPELEGICNKIAVKLKGSPLAAKTLGDILHANMTVEKWRHILDSELWQIEQIEDGILPALRVSYQYLPIHLKRCFQTFSLFPKDFYVPICYLCSIWVSDGIVNGEDGKDVEYYRDFENKSFFSGTSLHDLMHDLAKSLSFGTYYCLEGNNCSIENHDSVRHISVYRQQIELIDKEIGRCKNLRSLLFLYEFGSGINISSSTLASLFNQLIYLRALDLSNCQIEELPQNICNLKLLIFVNLWYAEIKSLPDSICQLYNLQVISVEGCPLKSFPKLFHNLINLRLITLWTEISTKILGIGKLTSLEILPEFKVLREDGHKIEELKTMNRIRDQLMISNLENVEGREDAARACLNNKELVNQLILRWSPGRNNSSENGCYVIDQNIIEGLQPHPNLENLTIENYGGRTPASWLQTGMLPRLKYLRIERFLNLESLNDWFLPHQFPLLHSFEITECPNLVSLPLEWISSSSITRLRVYNCPQLKCSNNLMLPASLTSLFLSSCGEFDMSLPGCLHNLNSLSQLTLYNCQITSIPSQVTHHIEALTLRNCVELQCLEVSNPSILEYLDIAKCPKLIQSDLSTSYSEAYLDRIQKLWDLRIDNTSLLKLPFLRNPPHSVQYLRISDSPEERMFTGDVQGWLNEIENLEQLRIVKCYKLQSLPEELHTLVTVRLMELTDCPKIQSLPENGLPPLLNTLEFDGCHPTLTEQLMQYKRVIEGKRK
jgi:NB-ARC domain